MLRINRYMLGCKCQDPVSFLHSKNRINRYMLGCKSVNETWDLTDKQELIDTCWDVN